MRLEFYTPANILNTTLPAFKLDDPRLFFWLPFENKYIYIYIYASYHYVLRSVLLYTLTPEIRSHIVVSHFLHTMSAKNPFGGPSTDREHFPSFTNVFRGENPEEEEEEEEEGDRSDLSIDLIAELRGHHLEVPEKLPVPSPASSNVAKECDRFFASTLNHLRTPMKRGRSSIEERVSRIERFLEKRFGFVPAPTRTLPWGVSPIRGESEEVADGEIEDEEDEKKEDEDEEEEKKKEDDVRGETNPREDRDALRFRERHSIFNTDAEAIPAEYTSAYWRDRLTRTDRRKPVGRGWSL